MKLFVGNLSYNTTEESLAAKFGTAGEIKECKIITDRETGRPRGFAFVTFFTRDAAINAIESHNNTQLDNRNIFVSEAKERAPRSSEAKVYRREDSGQRDYNR